jgi:HlyD family secretion protein
MAEIKELELGKANNAAWAEATPAVPIHPHKATGMKKWKKVTLAIVAIVAFIGLAVGGVVWSRRGVVTVQTGKVAKEDLTQIVTANGEIKPLEQNQANVNANSIGKITEILVKEGDHVTKGQLLMRTEDVQQAATVQAQEAAVTTSQADLSAQDASVLSSKAALDTAQADLGQAIAKLNQSTDNFKRGQELFKGNLLSQQDFDTRLSDYRVAQTTKDSAEAKVAQAKAQYQQALYTRDSARAHVGQNKAQLVGYQNQLAQTVYKSPLDGYITSLPVHLGENVVPGIQNSAGSLLYQVSNLSVMTAEVKVDETDIPNVKLEQTADVLIDAYPNKTFKGHVTQIGESAVGRTTGTTSGTTTTGGATATSADEAKDFKVVVVIDDPPPGLRPGLSATAKVTTATRKNAVAVPIQAVTVRMRRELEEKPSAAKGGSASEVAAAPKDKDQGKEEIQGLFVVRNGRATFAQVESGIMGSTDIEVLKGVEAGDTIVTGSFSVLRTLKNNTKVKIDNAPVAPVQQGAS